MTLKHSVSIKIPHHLDSELAWSLTSLRREKREKRPRD